LTSLSYLEHYTLKMAPTKIRLNHYLAKAGLTSRRGADALVFAGHVHVNGEVIKEPGFRVTLGLDNVFCDGQAVELPKEPLRYIMLHKPIHIVCTMHDPQKRKTVQDLLPPELRAQRLVPVGRLDYMSEGLLLLTNDGEVTWRLTHPRFEHPKEYEVLVREPVLEKALRIMRQGMRLTEGEVLEPVQVQAQPQKNGQTMLRMILVQGMNRQIRRMCRDLGLTILKLRRIRVGPIILGNLKLGTWRDLDKKEVALLKASLGLKSADTKKT